MRNWVDQTRILTAARPLHQTRPYPAAGLKQADAEVHMLLCRRDLKIGVLAIKSLLRREYGISVCQ